MTARPMTPAMTLRPTREQVREQIDISQDTFRSDYFAYLQKRSGETEAK